ncbi:MAG: hypothetical protein AAGA22_08680 [Pseudomonadota bacterium]
MGWSGTDDDVAGASLAEGTGAEDAVTALPAGATQPPIKQLANIKTTVRVVGIFFAFAVAINSYNRLTVTRPCVLQE